MFQTIRQFELAQLLKQNHFLKFLNGPFCSGGSVSTSHEAFLPIWKNRKFDKLFHMSHEEPEAVDHSSVEWDAMFDPVLSTFRTSSPVAIYFLFSNCL